jgi:hypothetical protein
MINLETLIIELTLIAINTIVIGFGYMLRRSMAHMDSQIARLLDDNASLQTIINGSDLRPGVKTRLTVLEERVDEHDNSKLRTEEQISKIIDTIQTLTSAIHAHNIKNSDDLGELKAEIREFSGILKGLANEGIR